MKRSMPFRLSTILFAATLLLAVLPAPLAVAAEEPASSVNTTVSVEPTAPAQGSASTTDTSAPASTPTTATAEPTQAQLKSVMATPTAATVGAASAVNDAIWASDASYLEITSPADSVLRTATGKINFVYQTQFDLSSLSAADMPDVLTLDLGTGNWPGYTGAADGKVVFDVASLKVSVGGVDVTTKGQWLDTTTSADTMYPRETWTASGTGVAALISSWSGKTITVKESLVIKDPAAIGAHYQSYGYIFSAATLFKTGATPEESVYYSEWDYYAPSTVYEIRIGIPEPESIVYVQSNALFSVNGNPGVVFLDPKNPSLAALPKLTDPTGVHKFLGWSNEPGVNNEVDIKTYGDLWNMDLGDLGMGFFVYAVWSGDDDQLATLTLDSNGAGFPQVKISYPAGTYWRGVVFDDYSDVPAGWQQSYTDSAGVHYLLGYSISPDATHDYSGNGYPGDAPSLTWDANLTLYAIWSKAFPVDAPTITFNYNRDAGDLDSVPNGLTPPYVLAPGQPLSAFFSDLGDGESPPTYIDDTYWWYGYPDGPGSYDGFSDFTIYYNFQGWSMQPGPDNTVNVDLNTMVNWDGNKTVYAVWDEIAVPNAQVWANDPNELKVTSPADATLRAVDGAYELSYKTSYDISMVDPVIKPDTLQIGFWAGTFDDSGTLDVGIDAGLVRVFVDGVDVTSSFSFLTWTDDYEGLMPANGLCSYLCLEVKDPALVTAWSGKTITVKAQAALMTPDDVEIPVEAEGQFDVQVTLYNSALTSGEGEIPPVYFQNQYPIDLENGIWTGAAPYYIDIPEEQEPQPKPQPKPKPAPLPETGDSSDALSLMAVSGLLILGAALVLTKRRSTT